jgi:hypothetical protein
MSGEVEVERTEAARRRETRLPTTARGSRGHLGAHLHLGLVRYGGTGRNASRFNPLYAPPNRPVTSVDGIAAEGPSMFNRLIYGSQGSASQAGRRGSGLTSASRARRTRRGTRTGARPRVRHTVREEPNLGAQAG